MKILYDLAYFNKEHQGGISKMWLEYFKLISKSNIDATFVVDLNAENITNDYLIKNNFFNYPTIKKNTFFNFPFIKKVKNSSFIRNFTLPFIIPKSTEIFHSTDFINPIIKANNTKIVTTIHDMVFWDQKNSFKKGISYWDKRWSIYHSLKISNRIITVSNNSKKSIIKYFPWSEKKIVVNYHGLSKNFLKVKINHNKKKYFMFIGGRNSYKNYNLLLNAFSKISKNFPEWKIIVIGENSRTKENEKIEYKNLGIEKKVIDYGIVDEKELIKLLSQSSALVIPSLNEGFNFPLLEALAVGCPVLSSNIAVSKEIGLNHVTYFSNSIESLKKCLIEIINKKVNRESLYNAQKYARRFNWSKSFDKLKEVYESCIR